MRARSSIAIESLETRRLLAATNADEPSTVFAAVTRGPAADRPASFAAVGAVAAVPQQSVQASGFISGEFAVGAVQSSADGRFQLRLQPGGDLWLTTSWAPGRPYWTSGTGGSNADRAVMQGDGNFVLYRGGVAVWSTGTNGNTGSVLVLQDDGNLVIYTPGSVAKWNSGTSWAGRTPSPASHRLVLNEVLARGESRYSPDRRLRLVLQDDGNFVLYAAGAESALWQSGTYGKAVTGAVMQEDGNFVLYGPSGRSVWDLFSAARISRRPGSFLSVQDDGNVVLYDPGSGAALWSTRTSVPANSGGVFVPPNNTSAIAVPPLAINIPLSVVLTGPTTNSGAINAGGRPVVLTGGNTLNQGQAINANSLVVSRYVVPDRGLNLGPSPEVPTVLNLGGDARVTAPGGVTVDGILGLSAGTVVSAETPVTVSASGRLRGAGTVAGAMSVFGTLTPAGDAAAAQKHGRLHVGRLSLRAGSRLELEVGGPTAGVNHDQVVVTDGVSVDGAVLAVDNAYAAPAGTSIVLVDNRGKSMVSGTFRDATGRNLAEGASVIANLAGSGRSARISYQGGDGNDVVLTVAAEQPGAPRGLVASAGKAKVDLSWQAPATNGGVAITDYAVQFKPVAATTWTTFADGTGTATSATVTGLTNGTAYVFRIVAVNAVGRGAWSTESTAATPRTAPSAPRNVVGAPGDSQVRLTWAAPVSHGGAAITDYVVEFKTVAATTWSTFVDGTGTAASATVTGLTNGTAYVFRVAAVNAGGRGAASIATPALKPRR